MSIVKEFREFAMQGNVMDMAIGIVIGGVFNPIVKSVVDDIVMPPIGLLLGGVNFKNLYLLLKSGTTLPGPYESLEAAQAAGAVTINYGNFISLVIMFLITAAVIFAIVKLMNRWRAPAAKPEAQA